MTILAWLGIMFFIFGIFGFSQRIFYMIYYPHMFVPGSIAVHITGYAWVGIIGVMLAIIGGLLARSRLLWPVLVVIGTAGSILAIYGIGYEKVLLGPISILLKYLLIFLLPGIACIVAGIIIRWLRRRQNIKSRFQIPEN